MEGHVEEHKPPLDREQIMQLVAAIDLVHRKRRLQFGGLLLALLVLIGGELTALVLYGSMTTPERFMGWMFLVPPMLVGAILWAFGRWARLCR